MLLIIEGSDLNRSWYPGLPTTRLLSLRARQSRRCCWVSSSKYLTLLTISIHLFSLEVFSEIIRINLIGIFPVESLDFSFVSAPSTSSLFKMRLWPPTCPTLLTSEICYGLLISHVTKFNIILHLWFDSILCI